MNRYYCIKYNFSVYCDREVFEGLIFPVYLERSEAESKDPNVKR